VRKVAVFGESRGFFEEMFCDVELKQISLPTNWRSANQIDLLRALSRPRSTWQSEYVRQQFLRTGSNVLISLIDNTEFYGYCANSKTGRRTIAIQNGVRLPESEWLYSIRRFRKLKPRPEFQHDIYVAWGSWDAERYLNLGGSARQLVVAGSLADALHRRRKGSSAEDIAVGVLEMRSPHGMFRDVPDFPDGNPEIMASYAQSIRILYRHIERFSKESGIQPHFILNSTHNLDEQLIHLNQLFSSNPIYHHSSSDTLASYDVMARCRVTLGVLSSLLVEAFGRGKRILALNPSGNRDLDFPIQGVWTLQDPRYEAFKERLMMIIEMSDDEWRTTAGRAPHSLIAYDPKNPTDFVVKNLVRSSV
jgi:surface carbohydrate biosynthesis protein